MQSYILSSSPPPWPKEISYIPAFSVVQTIVDLSTIALVAVINVLSLLSMYFIFHFRIKARKAPYLKRFNTLWSVRFLLVVLVTFWALIELLRIPFFRQGHIYPFLPSFSPTLTIRQQENLCKIHVILSLGFFEPGFLITLLFLVSVAVRNETPHEIWGILFVFLTCCPIFVSQVLLVAWSPFKLPLPEYFRQTSVVRNDSDGNDMVLCAHPLVGTIIFAAFGVTYAIWFMYSSWKVVSLVINKSLRRRIYGLVFTVFIALLIQIISLGLSVVSGPTEVAHSALTLLEFLCTLICGAVGESILVIKPILDSLSINNPCSLLLPSNKKSLEEGQRPNVDSNS